MIKNTKIVIAKSAVVAAAVTIALTQVQAQINVPKPSYKFQKCYGVSKAGQNDCFSKVHTCGGTAKTDNEADAWIYMPVGVCKKLVGGNTAPPKTQ